MANITTTGTTSYPAAIDTRTAVTDDPGGTAAVAAQINGVSAAALAIEAALGTTPQGSAADVTTRFAAAHNQDGTIKQTVIVSGTGTTVSYANGIFTIAYSADSAGMSQNVGLDASVAGNALTVTLVDKNGNALTSTSSAVIPFRPVTTTTAGYVVMTIPTPTSVVLPAGGTLNFGNSETGRIYAYGMFTNATTFEMALARQAIFDDAILQTTTAISASSAGASTLYSTTQRNGIPVKLLGYIDIRTGSTAGNWSNAPLVKQVYGPGIYRTGEVVQYIQTTTGAGLTTSSNGWGTGNITSPNGGLQSSQVVMTATSTINKIRARGNAHMSNNSFYSALAIFSTAQDHPHAIISDTASADVLQSVSLEAEFPVPSINSVTYFLMGNGNGGAVTRFNQGAGGAQFSGQHQTMLRIEEIFS